ncbi:hypothetical protein ACLOJK_023186 [Asimina triloba]
MSSLFLFEYGTQKGQTFTPLGEAKAERSAQPQCEEGSPSRNTPNNVTATRSLLVTGPLAPEDQASSNSLRLNPKREALPKTLLTMSRATVYYP